MMTQSSARTTGRLSGVAGLEQPEKQQRRHLHCHHAKQRAAEESRAMVKWRGAGSVKWQEDLRRIAEGTRPSTVPFAASLALVAAVGAFVTPIVLYGSQTITRVGIPIAGAVLGLD